MRKQGIAIILLSLTLTGCSNNQESDGASASPAEAVKSFGLEQAITEEAPAEGAEAAAEGAEAAAEATGTAAADVKAEKPPEQGSVPAGDIKVVIPQIAYSYTYGYRVVSERVTELQTAHANACEKKGKQICRILNLSQDGGEGDYSSATLNIEVAAAQARGFGDELAKLAKSKGGEPVSTSIQGEDLSKQIVDTEARLRARILLRDRLMEILRSRSGKVSELVEAERGVAEVNEEIDQAQSWLAEMKGRVAFSKMTISYNANTPSSGGFWEPIRYALNSAASVLGNTIGFMISAFIFLLPWALVLTLLLWLKKRHGWSWRFWRRAKKADD